jgi:hypothetical protein
MQTHSFIQHVRVCTPATSQRDAIKAQIRVNNKTHISEKTHCSAKSKVYVLIVIYG